MKKILLAAACALGLMTLSGCNNEDGLKNTDKTPIVFSGSMSTMTAALGDALTQTWQADDELGIYVYATSEMRYKINESSASTGMTAVTADIPVSYGTDAYAIYPPCSAKNRFEANIVVPNAQTYADGVNPDLFYLAAQADVVDGAADFEFKHLASVINLGLKSDDNVKISKLEISAPAPARGSYLAGEAKVFLSYETLDLGDVSKGNNTVVITFDEPLALSATPVYVPVAVLPFSTTADGLEVKVYEQRGYPSDLGSIWTGTNAVSEAGAVTLEAGECATEMLPAINLDMFDMPGTVKMTVKDAKTSSPRAGHEVSIYSLAGGVETLIDRYTSDASGVVKVELNAGEYVAYAPYSAGGPEKSNKVEFEIKSGLETSVELVLNPIVFFEDFSWVNTTNFPGIGPLYGDVPGHVANTAQNFTPQYTTWTAEQLALMSDRGWTSTSFVYARPGALTLGKKNGVGTVTSPALTGLSGAPVEITAKVIPWHTVTGGVWKLEYSQFTVKIVGEGSFSPTESVTEMTNKILTSGGDTNPGLESVFTMTLYGATSATKLSFCNGKPSESESTMYRLMFSEVMLIEK